MNRTYTFYGVADRMWEDNPRRGDLEIHNLPFHPMLQPGGIWAIYLPGGKTTYISNDQFVEVTITWADLPSSSSPTVGPDVKYQSASGSSGAPRDRSDPRPAESSSGAR